MSKGKWKTNHPKLWGFGWEGKEFCFWYRYCCLLQTTVHVLDQLTLKCDHDIGIDVEAFVNEFHASRRRIMNLENQHYFVLFYNMAFIVFADVLQFGLFLFLHSVVAPSNLLFMMMLLTEGILLIADFHCRFLRAVFILRVCNNTEYCVLCYLGGWTYFSRCVSWLFEMLL